MVTYNEVPTHDRRRTSSGSRVFSCVREGRFWTPEPSRERAFPYWYRPHDPVDCNSFKSC
jgi:hypothetical protein